MKVKTVEKQAANVRTVELGNGIGFVLLVVLRFWIVLELGY